MFIIVKEKEVEIKYTFNSFKYMQTFNAAELDEMENKPFLIIPMAEVLLMGGLNNDPKEHYSFKDVEDYLANLIDNLDEESISLPELLAELSEELQNSNFFKSLQKTPMRKTKKKK